MRRQESTEQTTRTTARPRVGPKTPHPVIGFVCFAGLILGMLMTASSVGAESTNSQEVSVSHPGSPPPPAAVNLSAPDAFDDAQSADPQVVVPTESREAKTSDTVLPSVGAPPSVVLVDLLLLRDFGVSFWKAESTDEILAAAIAIGSTPDLEPQNPFRKRKRDLFLKERPVSIGRAEMLLRLRLRAKTRKAVTVELRF